MHPEDKRCSKLETYTFFLSFFQDGVVLLSGPRNSSCAWTSILACFYSLPKHLCFILVAYRKMPYILILTGGSVGADGSVLQGFPGLLPSLIHFSVAPKASPGIWGCVSVLHLLPPPAPPLRVMSVLPRTALWASSGPSVFATLHSALFPIISNSCLPRPGY